jgi:hypothetical protein
VPLFPLFGVGLAIHASLHDVCTRSENVSAVADRCRLFTLRVTKNVREIYAHPPVVSRFGQLRQAVNFCVG